MRIFRRARWIVALGVVAAVAAGVSYAAVPSSNGTISACLDAKGGLKVIDVETGGTCAADKQLLTWNQQGPQGIPGPQGSKGDPGAPGVSMGYEYDGINKTTYIDGVAGATIGTLNLPGGKYVLHAKTEVAGNSNANVLVQCKITGGGSYNTTTLDFSNGVHRGTATLDAMATSPVPAQVQVWCRALGGTTNWAADTVITAVQVGGAVISF